MYALWKVGFYISSSLEVFFENLGLSLLFNLVENITFKIVLRLDDYLLLLEIFVYFSSTDFYVGMYICIDISSEGF